MAKKQPPATVLEYDGVDLTPVTRAIECWKQGMIDREVAETLKIPVCYVSAMRKMIGLRANFKHVSTRSRRQAAESMAKDGMDEHEIAKLLGLTPALIRTWIEEGQDDKS